MKSVLAYFEFHLQEITQTRFVERLKGSVIEKSKTPTPVQIALITERREVNRLVAHLLRSDGARLWFVLPLVWDDSWLWWSCYLLRS